VKKSVRGWMAQKQNIQKKPSSELNRKFTNIESKFTAMEDYIQSKFQVAIENYMNHSQKTLITLIAFIVT
jgi:hypothetical protein